MFKNIVFATMALWAGVCAQAYACAVPSRAIVSFPHYDAFNMTGAVQDFTVHFDGGSISDQIFVQFADRSANPGQAIGQGGPGPFAIFGLGSSAANLVAGPAPAAPPNPIGNDDAWARVAIESSRGAMANYQLRLSASRVMAGIYSSTLDVRVACRRADGSFDISEYPGALVVQAAVDDKVQVAITQAHIDLGDLQQSGAPSEARVSLPLHATGSYEVTVRSANGLAAGEGGGVLRLQGSADAAERIGYDLQANNIAITNQSRLMCSPQNDSIELRARTTPAPGAGRLAGAYKDTVEVEITPQFGGPAPMSGCVRTR